MGSSHLCCKTTINYKEIETPLGGISAKSIVQEKCSSWDKTVTNANEEDVWIGIKILGLLIKIGTILITTQHENDDD